MIRVVAGLSTTRFCALLDMPERTWRRWQAHARAGRPPKSPWPRPARDEVRDAAVGHALAHPAWGHRTIWAMVRHDGHRVSESTILRLLRDEGLILPAAYQRERRRLAQRRKAAFAKEPTRPEPGVAARPLRDAVRRWGARHGGSRARRLIDDHGQRPSWHWCWGVPGSPAPTTGAGVGFRAHSDRPGLPARDAGWGDRSAAVLPAFSG